MSHSPHVEIYRYRRLISTMTAGGVTEEEYADRDQWRWRFRAGNGRVISQSSEAYNDPRDLVRGLELSFPSYLLRDAGRSLEGVGGWYLWPGCYTMAPIRVRIPDGAVKLWRSRRNR